MFAAIGLGKESNFGIVKAVWKHMKSKHRTELFGSLADAEVQSITDSSWAHSSLDAKDIRLFKTMIEENRKLRKVLKKS